MLQMREAVGFAAFIVGAAALTAVNHHPDHGRRTERERIAVEAVAGQYTHHQISDAWTQAKLGNRKPLQDIQRAFPLPVRTVHEAGRASSSPSTATTRRASTSSATSSVAP